MRPSSTYPFRRVRYRRRLRAVSAAAITTVLALGLGQAPAWAERGSKPAPVKLQQMPAVPVKPVQPDPTAGTQRIRSATDAPAPVWPVAAVTEVAIPSATDRRAAANGPTRVGSLPVLIDHAGAAKAAPGRLRVQVLDRAATQKAGVEGLLVRTEPIGSTAVATDVAVTVDYRGFRNAYGGSWSSRLRLVELPECALSTPGRRGCEGRALPSRNVPSAATVSATAPARSLLALTAGPGGPAGDYSATDLKASSTWTAGGNSGGFTWSYPMRVPPAPGALEPKLELSYSSQSIDGRHPASNNQPSWVGGGFESWPGGYIERRYRVCAEDMARRTPTDPLPNNTVKTGDLCWATDNAVLNLNGKSSELLLNGNRWHMRAEDGSKVERKLGADNGDNNGEHWVVTSADGTQYWFGRQKLPGWAANDPLTNSTWTAPVFGNHTNEPCNTATYATSHCVQAWRWNLDHVIDPHGNSMSYWYTPETNKYGRNRTATDDVEYTRGGFIDHIAYGTRSGGVDTVLDTLAPLKVVFGTDDRCLSACTNHDALHWPDVPWDQECVAAATSCDDFSPTFWTTRRLSTITTQVRNGSGYDDVERWTLTHGFPDPGDSTLAGLWLEKISHAGLVGTDVTVPDIRFTSVSLDNRVDGIDGIDAMAWHRIARIDTETGAAIAVTYSDRDCTATGAKPAVHDNNRLCYPVKWIPGGQETTITDWFHKYVVKEIREDDTVAGNRDILYKYTYYGDPAWHYNDDDGIIKPSNKTWSDWRGYARVGVTVGENTDDTKTYSETRYFRGMHGDKQPSGTRTVNVTDSKGGTWPDEDWFAGMTREQVTYNGVGGPVVSGTINDPWASAPTATRTINGDTVTARYVRTATVRSRVVLDAGRGERVTKYTTSFDAHGQAIQVDDFGQDGVPGDEQCTKTTYEPRDTDNVWIVNAPHRVQRYAVGCAATANPATLGEDDVIADLKTFYDGATVHGTPATRGDVTQTQQMSAWNAGSPTHVTASQTAYDGYGRATSTTDANGNTTTTEYIPATGGPVTGTKVTNAKQHETLTTLNPAWASPVTMIDANLKKTELTYDGLGRLTGVWKPGRTKGTDSANVSYTYNVRADRATAVTSDRLGPNGNRIISHTLYDGLLRQVQTQSASPGPTGGRILTNTFYDSLGRPFQTYGAYHDAAALQATNPTLYEPVEPLYIPHQYRTLFDGAGREVADVFRPNNVERWRTTTYHAGDRIDVTPPAGGTATSSVTDARGRMTQLWQYPRLTAWDSGLATTYVYNRKGQLTGVSDPDGNDWAYTYDIRGRKTTDTDPDRGTTTYGYDNGGRLTSTIDARNNVLVYTYDQLNRKTAVYQNRALGTPRASWVYDTVAKGQPTGWTRNIATGVSAIGRTTTFNDLYQPTHQEMAVVGEANLAGTYQYQYGYKSDGSPESVTFLAVPGGDLASETMTQEYNDLGLPTRLKSTYGATTYNYVSATHYDPIGQLLQYNLCDEAATVDGDECSETGVNTRLTYEYELSTGRMTRSVVDRDTASPHTLADVHYSRDDAGNITKISDIVGTDDNQCFAYDYLRRLTNAWTPTSGDCTATPTTAGLGGPAPYWLSWQYDNIGNRAEQVDHRASGNITTSYTYPNPGQPRPHAVTSTTTDTTTTTYGYNNTGDTTSRPGPNGTQTLAWDPEGKLASTTETGNNTSYAYDADGNRLIRRDATGKTLYLPGQEIRFTNATGTKSITRHYNHGTTTIASRTIAGLVWLAADHQGTNQIAIDATTHAVTQRRQTPFGTPRGFVPTNWPNQKGFVGGTNDPTKLVNLGAREYDPTTGRFISVDPIMDMVNPQQWNAYAYSNNTPITSSDPTGLCMTDACFGHKLQTDDRDKRVGCGSANACEGPEDPDDPKTVLDKPNDLPTEKQKELIKRGYKGSKAFTNRELLEWGSQTNYNWEYICASIYGFGDYWSCQQNNPFTCKGLSCLHPALAGCGMLPGGELCDAADFVLSVAEGDAVGAALSAGSFVLTAIPLPGLAKLSRFERASPDVGDAAASCLFRSFSADTHVLMADGTAKPISDVKAGDEVMATDPETGKRGARAVTHIWVHQDELVDLRVEDDRLTTTEDHPFWNHTDHEWQLAGDLNVGDRLLTAAGGTVLVGGLIPTTRMLSAAYNLSVEGINTYYVLAGRTPVLVHNSGCDEWAAGFVKKNGGEIKTFTGPDGTDFPLGEYRPKGPGTPALGETWFHHTVVVRDGKVYDQWHPSGIGIDEYKTRFDYRDDINFGF